MSVNRPHENIAWQGKSWCLRVAERKLSSGTVGKTAYIDHPGSVVIVPCRKSGRSLDVLMLSQYRYALDDTILELPAGTLGWGEEPTACAQRELREETGFRADRFENLGRFWPAPGVTNEVMTLFLASGLHHDPLPKDEDEEIEVISYRLDDLFAMAVNGRLHDAKSVVGIVRAAIHLKIIPSDWITTQRG